MRLGVGCGCLGIMLSVAALIVIFVLPSVITDNDGLNRLMGSIFCGDAEAYVNESQSYSTRPGSTTYTLQAGCQKPDNVIQDVSMQQGLLGFGVFVIGLLGGIGLIIFSSVRTTTKRLKSALNVNGVSLTDLSNALSQRPTTSGATASYSERKPKPKNEETLAEKLRQLEESYEAHLINKEEYDDARKRLLDNFHGS